MPINIFFCYAHEDEELLNKLKAQLVPLKRQHLIDVWHDRDINAGTAWELEIDKHLNSAQIILLLISPDFMNSDYCYGIEMKRALERHKRGEAHVIPVILRHVYWQGIIGKIQALPKDGKPITDHRWHNLDEAFYNVAEGIRKVVEEEQGKQPPPLGTTLLVDNIHITQKQAPSLTLPFPESIFHYNVLHLPVADEFYGRVRDRTTLIRRTKNGDSTSVIGSRRIGKTWLIDYLKLVAPFTYGLDSNCRIGYLDASQSSCETLSGFISQSLEVLGNATLFSAHADINMVILERAVKSLISNKLIPILCIDEFDDICRKRDEFNINFLKHLRSIAVMGLVLVIASKRSIIEIEREISGSHDITSNFFNIFEQLTLKPFVAEEAKKFAHEKSIQAGFSDEERERLLEYGQIDGASWPPLRLQLVGNMLLLDKNAAIENSHYYRPNDLSYWRDFEMRLEEKYQAVIG